MATLANAALLLIDMQNGMANTPTSQRNNPSAESNITALLTTWRKTSRPIIHIHHISRNPSSVFYPGQPSCEFQPAFTPLSHEAIFEKNVPDAFCNSGLERWLHQRGIKQLVFCGVSTNNSVEATVRSAGNLGFEVQVVGDACFTFDLEDWTGRVWKAQEVHDMALANLGNGYAEVVECEAVLGEAGEVTE